MRKIFLWTMALLLASIQLAHADLYEEAETLFSAGNYSEALKKTAQLLETDPAQPAFLYLDAMAASRAGSVERAGHSFNRLLGLPATEMDEMVRRKAYANYARSLLGAKQTKEARKLLIRALNEYDSDPWLYNVSGRLYLSEGAYVEAITDLSRSVQLDDSNWIVFNNLGLAQLNLGRYEDALTSFNSAIKLAPPIPFLYNNRGSVREQLGDLERALTDFRAALRINPEYEKARISANRVEQLLQSKNP